MNAISKLTLLGVAAMAAACSHTTTREIVREQPIVQQQPVVQTPPTTIERTIVLQPPPAPQETRPAPPASTGYTWLPGHWAYRDNAWQWEAGSWHAGVIPPMPDAVQETIPAAPVNGSRWVPGYWSYSGGNWNWVRGHWQ